MKDAKRAGETFDEIADHFDKTRNTPWDEVVNFLERCEGSLLDLGCGNGRHIIEAKKRELDIYGIDASSNLLQICKNKFSGNIDFIRADVKILPFEDEMFDNIIYIATIHHLKEGRVDSLKEAKRVLKIDGKLMVSSWAREQERWDLDEDEQDVIVPWHHEDGRVIKRFYHLYRLGELEKDVEKAGLKILESFNSKGNNYVVASRT